jgi:hypothetical protein
MIYEKDSVRWAEKTFGRCNLDDPRRESRLVDIAARLSNDPSGSLTRICRGDSAAQEGTYKFVENNAVRPEAVAEGVHAQTAKLVAGREVCLAIQDTTLVDVSDYLKEDWKEQGSPAGFQVHSTLAVDGQSLEPLGLLDQARWLRAPKGLRPGKKTRAARAPEAKESYKWTAALEAMGKRLRSMANIISVCDREADIYDFLLLQNTRNYRFVVRATHDRKLEESNASLVEQVSGAAVLGQYVVSIGQRGRQRVTQGQQPRKARQKREAITELRAMRVSLSPPSSAKERTAKSISVNVVFVNEPNPPADTAGIRWLLLTTEPIDTLEQILSVVRYYSARWLIEEFHKAWKTGCGMEKRRLQTYENFERVMVITAAVAVRILQLRSLSASEEKGCETVLEADEWQCLFANTEPGRPLPGQPPSAKWAYYALAKLAGWSDSKRTGRVGWQTLWTGWERLQFLLAGWRAAIQLGATNR